MGCGSSAGSSEEKGTVNTPGTGASEEIAVDNTLNAVTTKKTAIVNTDPRSPQLIFCMNFALLYLLTQGPGLNYNYVLALLSQYNDVEGATRGDAAVAT